MDETPNRNYRLYPLRPNANYENRAAVDMARGYPEDALRDFDRAIPLRSDFPQADSNRGNACLREKRIDLALADFHRAGRFQLALSRFSVASFC